MPNVDLARFGVPLLTLCLHSKHYVDFDPPALRPLTLGETPTLLTQRS